MKNRAKPLGRIGRVAAVAVAALLATAPSGAVGLGPLKLDGVIDGPRRGFGLTLYNPYEETMTFRAYAVGADDETVQTRVDVIPDRAALGPRTSRRLLVIANDLQLNETYRFRVCAERAVPPTGVAINARVCSTLSARRVG